ncbi:expressed unknown protein [Seminavis robusta]|uniref:Uncharacterized protein n=1 Tax=Seminavis robusta TaxID=568900 RepID=A0A9N8ENP0_9STRA|nr:expressed unknown protein [Seminavis robusta]|eukprot:Sro1293_g260090.1 n/a (324) ;mRNA; f:4353-5324
MSTATTSQGDRRESSDIVYFRFEGQPGTGVDEIDISLSRQVLQAFSDSLLTKLADDEWKSDENKTAGETASNPLITKPLESPCREEWSPCLAEMIAETYRWKHAELRIIEDDQAKEGNRPALPPNVTLEDALCVLEYYGVTLDDPSMISFEKLDTESQIRAKLFLKDLALIDDAADLVLEELKQNPQRETLFLFAKRCHNMQYINTHNYLGVIYEPRKFVRVGNDLECNLHFGWAQDDFHREHFIEQIRKELPSFDVEYMKSLVPDESWYEGELALGAPDPDSGCWVSTRQDQFNSWQSYEDMVVLRVCVPVRKAQKRPRDDV